MIYMFLSPSTFWSYNSQTKHLGPHATDKGNSSLLEGLYWAWHPRGVSVMTVAVRDQSLWGGPWKRRKRQKKRRRKLRR